MTEVVYMLVSVDVNKCEDDTFTHVISVFKSEDDDYRILRCYEVRKTNMEVEE